MKRLYLNCMFYTHFMILDIMFIFYCMKFYQRHYLLSKVFSPSQRCHGVYVTISIYTLVLLIYVLFLCDFTCVVWLMGQLWPFCVNKMTTTTTGRHFANDIFKCIFLNENVWIPVKISLKFVPKGPINNIPALIQIMAWHWPGNKPLS